MKKASILSIVLFIHCMIHAQDSLYLYLLIGQSNMAGRGEITGEYVQQHDPRVMMLDKEGNWVTARHPLHFDKPAVAGVGPGLSFGISMEKWDSSHRIGLIPCAVGGTSINVWQPGAFDKGTNTYPYDDAMKRLDVALKSGGILKGVIWLQGEADSNPEKSKDYLDKLVALIHRIRTVVKNPALPFIAGQIGQFKEQYQNINTKLPGLSSMIDATGIVTSEGLTDKGDQTHFDARSADEYGKRFAEKMKTLLTR